MTSDRGQSVVLVLLDLSPTFDTVDHQSLLSRLDMCTVLNWFQSYLQAEVSLSMQANISQLYPHIIVGYHKASFWAQFLLLYTCFLWAPFFKSKKKIAFQCFADDVQIYLLIQIRINGSLLYCLEEIHSQVELNFLNLNMKKTKIIVFGQRF